MTGQESPAVRIILCQPDFMVVDKPPFLLSHLTRPDGAPNLLSSLQALFPGEPLALVNRLDRETSGAILVARSASVSSKLGKLTQDRQMNKQYLALVYGLWPEQDRQGCIENYLGRLGMSAQNPIWVKQGILCEKDSLGRKSALARTEYWLEQQYDHFSLLRLRAHTGRLHQLRVHLAAKGFPVVGDKIYGPDANLYLRFIDQGWTPDHQRQLLLPRHALHASRLEFVWKDQMICAETPLPADLACFIAAHQLHGSGLPPSR